MICNMNIKKLEELKNNDACQKELASASTAEEVCEILKQYGAELSMQEVQELLREEKELSAEDLENVAGGCHGLKHIIGYKIVWAPIGFIRGLFSRIKVLYGPKLVPIYCNKR